MTPAEQRHFVLGLCKSVAADIVEYDFPAHWGGHEIRILLAQTFAREAQHVIPRKWRRRIDKEIAGLQRRRP